jgi:hypothetical protein
MSYIAAGSKIITAFGPGVVLSICPSDSIVTIQLKWGKLHQKINTSLLTPSIKDLSKEILRRRPIVNKVRKHVLNLGLVPNVHRKEIYRILLKVQKQTQKLPLEVNSKVLDKELKNQRVIRADVLRTRTQDKIFQQDQTRHELEILLTYFCKRKGCNYRQGLNEVLAPFLWIVPTSAELSLRFEIFYAFVDRFLSNIFLQDEFTALQCSHVLFKTLLRHHDILLYEHFVECNLSPELYSTPWFLTLFASKLNQQDILRLWDHLIMLNQRDTESYIFHFGLALLILNRKSLLTSAHYDLPLNVVNLKISNIENVLKLASDLQRNTPQYFSTLVKITTLKPEKELKKDCTIMLLTGSECTETREVIDALDHSLSTVVIPVFTQEIIHYFTSSSYSSGSSMKYYFLDVRTFTSYHRNGHFPMSYHVDPTVLNESEITLEWMRRELEIFKSMSSLQSGGSGCCLCVIGSHSDKTIQDAQNLLKTLTLWRFNRLATFIDFDVLINDNQYENFKNTHLILSTKDEEEFALETMSTSLRKFRLEMEPELVPLPKASKRTNGKLREPQETMEFNKLHESDAPTVNSKEYEQLSQLKESPDTIEAKSAEGINDSKKSRASRTSALLSKGASALGALWNRASASAAFVSRSKNVPNTDDWHRDDVIENSIVLSLGGKQIRRVRERNLVNQFVILTLNHVIFLEKNDEESMIVLSKYPIKGLLKVSSRKKKELMVLIMTFSHTLTTAMDINKSSGSSSKKVGLVAENEIAHKLFITTLKTNYKTLLKRDQ